ncbi:MAG: M13 family metallopeptidase [Alloprevotella sp.]|nr:M13 family metallopeptidase [Alloprevotella sp.]
MTSRIFFPLAALFAVTAMGQTLKSGIDKSAMNTKVKPGTDFYDYATAGWRSAHPLTAEYSRYGQFNVLQEENQKQLRELIEGLAAEAQPQGSLGQKIGGLYRLAMDSTRRNAEGFAPIRPLLERIAAVKTRPAYQFLVAQLARKGVPSLMFSVYCAADLREAAMNLVQIDQGGLSMGERDYYLGDDESTVRIREAYRQYVYNLFRMVGNDEAAATKKRDYVLAVETQIAEASYTAVKRRDVEANYHKMGYAELLEEYPGIDWGNTLLALGYPSVEAVSVSQPEPIHEVEKILSEASLDALKAYAEFKVIDDAADALDDAFRAESFGFYSRTMRGVEQDKPRWKRAVGSVDDVMGMALGRLYVEKYFPESSKQRMLELVENLRVALGERIQGLTWMGDATKRQAMEKLASFYVKIGYPDTWRDYSGLQIDEQQSYYENLSRANEFLLADQIARRVNKPVDKTEWLMTPQTINAYYNPTTNEICFPAGILQPPFFNPEADDAANYGAIGVVIGHEMTHGFDDQGAQFDKDGNLRNWWTDEDKARFTERTKVMEEFFNGVEVLPDMRANGKLTLGENIADNGGLNVAYQALQNAMRTRPLGMQDGLTPEQRFFVSYGLIWAENIRDEQLRQYNKTDPHSPARWRVNGALPHVDAWYSAFGVGKRDKLFVPKAKRVAVW